MHMNFDTVRLEDIPYRTIDYIGEHTSSGLTLQLDIVRPDPLPPDPMPVVIYVFGSGWAENRRKDEEQNPAQFLAAQAGFCVVSIDYRLSSQAIFPAQIADARVAVRWLRAHAQTYHLDPERIGVWGYSSGGHLAALLCTAADEPTLDDNTDLLDFSCHVQAVVLLSPPVDFLQMGGWHNEPDSAEARLVGGPLHENVEKVRRANPITYINKNIPPCLLIHGDQDDVVLIQQSHLLYQALVNAGAEVTFLPLHGAGHDVRRSTPYWSTINDAALAFFMQHLRSKDAQLPAPQ